MEYYEIREDGTAIINEGVDYFDFTIKFWRESDKRIITKIIFPSTITEIGVHACSDMPNLKEVVLPEGVEKLGPFAFARCSLEKINFPTTLKELDENALASNAFTELVIPDTVEVVGKQCFEFCKDMKEITLPNGLKEISDFLFANCWGLEKINMPDSVERVGAWSFEGCDKLKRLEFSDALKEVSEHNPFEMTNFEEVIFPIETYIPEKVLENVKEMNVFFREKNGEKFAISELAEMRTGAYQTVMRKRGDQWYFNNLANGYKKVGQKELFSRANKFNDLESMSFFMYPKILDWLEYEHVPHKIVVENMPREEIELFYANKNMKNWGEILKQAQVQDNVNKASLFDLAHALGVFSPFGKVSECATAYIKERILTEYNEDQIHELFLPLRGHLPFNENFAKFFMKHFTKENPNFLMATHKEHGEFNALGRVCRDFDKILKARPNKYVESRNTRDELTIKDVLDVLYKTEYENVDERARDFADYLGDFGFMQKEYELLQEWFLKGISIPKEDLILKTAVDPIREQIEAEKYEAQECGLPEYKEDDNRVTFELLDKSDPLCAVIGNLTNCCQTVGGAGHDCVKYGMTMSNSGFVVFRNKGEILGQAWVWFDEASGCVCLDNIEVPTRRQKILDGNHDMQAEFLVCLDRTCAGFKEAMGDKVKEVTVGLGYNDFKSTLEKNYAVKRNCAKLEGYAGYSDASSQLVLADYSQELVASEEVSMER